MVALENGDLDGRPAVGFRHPSFASALRAHEPDRQNALCSATLYLQHRSSPAAYEQTTAADWIRRYQGKSAWRTAGPLLYQKFAERADQVAMVWMWGKLRLRGRSRSSSGLGERLGYMRGSFALFVEALEARVIANGGSFELKRPVKRIEWESGKFRLVDSKDSWQASHVLVAAPVPDYLEIAGHLLEPLERGGLEGLQATSAICTVLEMDRSLTPGYWLNIADPICRLAVSIQHTNYIPRDRTRHEMYWTLELHVSGSSPLPGAETKGARRAISALAKINPSFDPSWVVASHHFRAEVRPPLVTVGYREQIPIHAVVDSRTLPVQHGPDLPRGPRAELRSPLRRRAAGLMLDDLVSDDQDHDFNNVVP